MRPLAVIRYDVDFAQMDRAPQVQGALLGNLLVSRQDLAQQFEHGFDSPDGGHLSGLRIVESEKIAVPRAPQTAHPAALPDLADQLPQITNYLAADCVPSKQVAGEG